MKLINLVGQQFDRLTVIERAENNERGDAFWLCQCECGVITVVMGYNLRSGATRSCGCLQSEVSKSLTSESSCHWKGGKTKHGDGYIMLMCPNHPRATKTHPYIMEHVLVMEAELGRYLTDDEVVHHRNTIKDDNKPSNLRLMPNRAAHMSLHRKELIPW